MEYKPANKRQDKADRTLAQRLTLANQIVAEFKKNIPVIKVVQKTHSKRKLKSRSEAILRSIRSDVTTEQSPGQELKIPKDPKTKIKWESELPFKPLTDQNKPTKRDQLREKLEEVVRPLQNSPSGTRKTLPKEVESYYKNLLNRETENKKEDEEDELKDIFTSAADTLRKKLEESQTVFPLLRLIIIGCLNFTDDKEEIIKLLFEESVHRINTEKPFGTVSSLTREEKDALFGGWILLSGFLICYGSFFLHYVEGPEYFLKIHVEDLIKEIQSPVSKLTKVKMLQTSGMFIKRSFPKWIYFIIKGPNDHRNIQLKADLDECSSLIEECRLKIYLTGAVVRKYMEDSLSEEEIEGYLTKTVPKCSMLKSLMTMKILPSLNYYVDIYQDRGTTMLLDENTWTKFDDKNIYKMIDEDSDGEEWKEFEEDLRTSLANTS